MLTPRLCAALLFLLPQLCYSAASRKMAVVVDSNARILATDVHEAQEGDGAEVEVNSDVHMDGADEEMAVIVDSNARSHTRGEVQVVNKFQEDEVAKDNAVQSDVDMPRPAGQTSNSINDYSSGRTSTNLFPTQKKSGGERRMVFSSGTKNGLFGAPPPLPPVSRSRSARRPRRAQTVPNIISRPPQPEKPAGKVEPDQVEPPGRPLPIVKTIGKDEGGDCIRNTNGETRPHSRMVVPHVNCGFCREKEGTCYPVLPYGDQDLWKSNPLTFRLPITDYNDGDGTGYLHFECDKCCQPKGTSAGTPRNEECKLLLPNCEWGDEEPECKSLGKFTKKQGSSNIPPSKFEPI